MYIELVSQRRFRECGVNDIGRDTVERHSNVRFSIAHVNLHQSKEIACLPLEQLLTVDDDEHWLRYRIFGPAQYISYTKFFSKQQSQTLRSAAIQVQIILRVLLDIAATAPGVVRIDTLSHD